MLILLTLIINNCKTTIPNSYKYNEINSIKIKYKPININDSITRIYFKTDKENLLHYRRDKSDSLDIKFMIILYLTKLEDEQPIVYKYNMKNIKNKNGVLLDYFDIKVDDGYKYNARLEFFDVNRNFKYSSFIFINKTGKINEDYFLIKDSSENIIFNSFVKANQKIKLECTHKDYQEFKLEYYQRGHKQNIFEYNNDFDSSFIVKSKSFISLKKEGLYVAKKDEKTIFYILCVNDGLSQYYDC